MNPNTNNPPQNPPQPTNQTSPAPQPQPVAPSPVVAGHNPHKARTITLLVITALLLAAAAGAGVYAWRQQSIAQLQRENQQLKSQLVSQNDTNQTETATADQPDTAVTSGDAPRSQALINDTFISGQVAFKNNDVHITVYEKVLDVEEMWIEWGTDPKVLDNQTAKQSDLGAGADTYDTRTFVIPQSELSSTQTYFYRVAAKSGSEIRYSDGITAFQNQ